LFFLRWSGWHAEKKVWIEDFAALAFHSRKTYFYSSTNFLQMKVGDTSMNGIILKEDEPFEKALRRFTKTCERAGILSDIKKYRHYEKPSEERKRKINASRRKKVRDEKRFSFRTPRYFN
jgi:small subunit ribosomal protein S21